ncbi:hypothetical protein TSOC_007053 [Tetrabaena socialis]|uniref:SET domain-containing protein n=1 Tax=Tetrabaena socialis TaxID=47790 RepID=A0A2J8A269_9CHLO|nr:hypothetical protein TSOC_007053 [Tetrabaena socialis]|eukprot:PNH06595.1 hypothetical protein TSOC_007053 [Tetrabaena socialis]
MLERLSDGFDIDCLADVRTFPDGLRGLTAAEHASSTALLTVPLSSTLAVMVEADGGSLTVVAPPELPPNVKKAFEACIDRVFNMVTLTCPGPTTGSGRSLRPTHQSRAVVSERVPAGRGAWYGPSGSNRNIHAAPPPPSFLSCLTVVADLIRDTQDYQLVILAVLLLWARKYGNEAWQEYCNAFLPPVNELSCLLNYSPGDLPALQLPQLMDEAGRQHDWARWVHSQWTSSTSGALRRLELADNLEDTTWALANVRSRAVEFPIGMSPGAAPLGPYRTAAAPHAPNRGPVIAVLAPLTDLANHSSDPNCVVQLTTDRSRVVLLPRRPVQAGEPLTVDYGYNRSSVELMADYGFVMAGNPFDGEVALTGADKLPPLDLQRLEAAARALQRQQEQWLDESAQEEGEAGAAMDADARPQAVRLGSGGEACFSGRLRAAVALLSPRVLVAGGAGSATFSTPATQRIVAGLHHKLVRHCSDSFPTTLEQDRQLLGDMRAGRVSGMTAGMSMELDPHTPTFPTQQPQQRQPQPAAQAQEAGQAAVASGPAGSGSRAGGTAAPTLTSPAASGSASPPASGPESRAVALRAGRRVGRLYAAVRARVEHKELLRVAEELLMEYGRR